MDLLIISNNSVQNERDLQETINSKSRKISEPSPFCRHLPFLGIIVPKEHVVIIAVKFIKISTIGAFTHFAECNFAKRPISENIGTELACAKTLHNFYISSRLSFSRSFSISSIALRNGSSNFLCVLKLQCCEISSNFSSEMH